MMILGLQSGQHSISIYRTQPWSTCVRLDTARPLSNLFPVVLEIERVVQHNQFNLHQFLICYSQGSETFAVDYVEYI